jgi:hypothetical protein
MEEREETRSTADVDAAIESALLQLVLELHPASLTLAELVREMGEEAGRDAVERAVHDLVAAGLLHHSDAFVRPTRAALRFDQLLEA